MVIDLTVRCIIHSIRDCYSMAAYKCRYRYVTSHIKQVLLIYILIN